MKYVFPTVLSLALVMFAAGDALAFSKNKDDCPYAKGNASGKHQMSMDKLDANKDGKITFEDSNPPMMNGCNSAFRAWMSTAMALLPRKTVSSAVPVTLTRPTRTRTASYPRKNIWPPRKTA